MTTVRAGEVKTYRAEVSAEHVASWDAASAFYELAAGCFADDDLGGAVTLVLRGSIDARVGWLTFKARATKIIRI